MNTYQSLEPVDLRLWDLNWMKDGRHFLNRKYHPKSRIPKLVCTIPQTRGVLDTTHARTTNWFHTYLRKSFQQVPENSAMFNEFFTLLFENLNSIELLSNKQSKDGPNFGINPNQLFVSKSVINYGCMNVHQHFISLMIRTHLKKGLV